MRALGTGPTSWPTRLLLAFLAAAAGTVSLPVCGYAQTFQGRVVDGRDERPVATALVRLVDVQGEALSVTIADSTGFYSVEAPEPGIYRLEAARLGFLALESPLLDASIADGIYPIDLLMTSAPVELPGFTVETDRLSDEEIDRGIRLLLGTSPKALRYRPIEFDEIQDHIARGHNLEDLLRWSNTTGLVVEYTADGPCYSFRARGCLPVFLNGLPLNRDFMTDIPLDMVYTIVVVTPTDPVAPGIGAGVMLYTEAWLR
jgi:Carboxypeptidase regulatory-like domain